MCVSASRVMLFGLCTWCARIHETACGVMCEQEEIAVLATEIAYVKETFEDIAHLVNEQSDAIGARCARHV